MAQDPSWRKILLKVYDFRAFTLVPEPGFHFGIGALAGDALLDLRTHVVHGHRTGP
jgi:hypothetical protein